jgi:hypothetical protein
MARSSSAADFEIITSGVAEQKTPGSALNKTVAALALYGYRKAPSLSTVTHPEYGKLFLYEFKATPFGDLVLTAGGSVWPTLDKVSDLPIASGVPGRFAVAAVEQDLPESASSAVARGQKAGDRWAQRFESPPAIRAPRPSRASEAPVHIVHEAAPEVVAEVVERGYPAVKYGRGRPQVFGPRLPAGFGESAPEPEPEHYGPAWYGDSEPSVQAWEAPRAAAAKAPRQPRAPRAVAAPAPAAGGGGDAAFLAAMQSLISQM